jgi:glycosyltransferase involved in cell wall biosynthesis
MRIAIVAPYDLAVIGGVERYILSFAKAICPEHEVVLFTDSKPALDGVEVSPLSSISASVFDLCLTHAIYGSSGLPKAHTYLHTFHGTILGNLRVRPWLLVHPRFLRWFWLEMQSIKAKHGIIGVSQRACQEIRSMGYGGALIRVPSGGGFQGEEFKGSKLDEGLKLLYCGRTSDKVKRFSMIEKGFRLAHFRNPKMELTVLGGSKRPEKDGMIFKGERPYELGLKQVREAHLQINASYYEGSSLALAEGIFQGGLPTLATRTGGNLDMVEEGKTGFFFDSASELSVYLLRFSQDLSLRKSMYKNLLSQSLIPSWNEVGSKVVEFAESLSEK